MSTEVRRSDERRFYLREHPLALWFSVGAVITGIPLLFVPILGEGSSALTILPPAAVAVWAAWYALGGILSLAGMIRYRSRVEAAGMALLASALSVTVVTIIAARGLGAALSVGFLGTLVIGCASRSYMIATRHRWTR